MVDLCSRVKSGERVACATVGGPPTKINSIYQVSVRLGGGLVLGENIKVCLIRLMSWAAGFAIERASVRFPD